MALLSDQRLFRFGPFEVWPAERRLLRDGQPCTIGGRAFDLLIVLLHNRGRVVGVPELMRKVWPGLRVERNNVQVQVWALRQVLGEEAIVTVPRRGYRLVERAGPHGRAAAPAQAGLEARRPAAASTAAGISVRARLRWNPRADED